VRATHFEGHSAYSRKPSLCTVRACLRSGRKFLDCAIQLLTELCELRPDDVEVRNFWRKSDFVPGTYLCFSLSVCVCSLLPVWAVWPIFITSFGRYVWRWVHFSCESSSYAIYLTYILIFFPPSNAVSWRCVTRFCRNCHTYAHLYSYSWSPQEWIVRPPVCPFFFLFCFKLLLVWKNRKQK
jgi:hypothetical protein